MNDEGREVGHCGFLLLVAVHQETSRILASGIHHPPVSAPRRSATSTPSGSARPGVSVHRCSSQEDRRTDSTARYLPNGTAVRRRCARAEARGLALAADIRRTEYFMFIRMPNEVILLLQHFSALRVLSGAQPLGLLHVFGRTSFWIGQVFPPKSTSSSTCMLGPACNKETTCVHGVKPWKSRR